MLNSKEGFVLESICGLKNIQNVLDDFISRPIEWKLQSVFEILKENEVMYILEKMESYWKYHILNKDTKKN